MQCAKIANSHGPVAQLGERSVRIREVEGSNPFRSTTSSEQASHRLFRLFLFPCYKVESALVSLFLLSPKSFAFANLFGGPRFFKLHIACSDFFYSFLKSRQCARSTAPPLPKKLCLRKPFRRSPVFQASHRLFRLFLFPCYKVESALVSLFLLSPKIFAGANLSGSPLFWQVSYRLRRLFYYFQKCERATGVLFSAQRLCL